MTTAPQAVIALDHCAALGERPLYEPAEDALYWVDSLAPSINRLSLRSGENHCWPLPRRIGTFALKAGGGAVLALDDGVYDFAFDDGPPVPRVRLDFAPQAFLNDGRCDPQGRFWVSSALAEGHVYRLDASGLRPLIDGVAVGNGMAWSPDGRTMYVGCCLTGRVWQFDYDRLTGTPTNRRLFVSAGGNGVFLDGAAVDSEGGYWLCLCGAGRIERFLPDGTHDRSVTLPSKRPTMLAFGGPDLATAYVTTAGAEVDPSLPPPLPGDGCILALDLGVRGLPEPKLAS